MKYAILSIALTLTVFTNSRGQNSTSDFKWLEGNWKGSMGSITFYEKWIVISDSLMIGQGVTLSGKDTLVVENLRIQKIGKFLAFIPAVGDSHPVLFTLTETKDDQWTFENMEHDFPQRITYKKLNTESFVAYTEGEEKGKQRKNEFAYQKIIK